MVRFRAMGSPVKQASLHDEYLDMPRLLQCGAPEGLERDGETISFSWL